MILHIPVGDHLNYWCIGYIEKIDGGHHRHYEFFIWMLRRLNYRAVRATLLTASYMGPLISAMAENRLAYVQVGNRIIYIFFRLVYRRLYKTSFRTLILRA